MEGCSQTTIEVIGMDAHSRKLALCLMRREGGKIVKVKTVATTLDALEGTYRKQMPSGALTVLEASTNSFCIAARLKAIGFDAKVLNADVLSGLSRQDRVNDRIDAENLARAYLRYAPNSGWCTRRRSGASTCARPSSPTATPRRTPPGPRAGYGRSAAATGSTWTGRSGRSAAPRSLPTRRPADCPPRSSGAWRGL